MKMRKAFLIMMILLFWSSADARIVTEKVSYQDGGVQLQGYLYYDDSFTVTRPAVLVVHEWWGLNEYARMRAEQLANLGYVAFALDMYGEGKVTNHPDKASAWMKEVNSNVHHWQRRALTGFEVLRRHVRTDSERIAAIGYCFGGATVQQLAYSGANVKGVVSFHGSLINPLVAEGRELKAKILICHGAADPFVKKEAVESYIIAMENSGLDWQMIFFGGAKHSFTNPHADRIGMAALKYDQSADHRSWSYMKAFLEEIFGRD
jgi:dienelactone hydrolase